MPVCADPDDLLPFSLRVDRDKPDAERPVFLLRYLTEKESTKVDRLLAEADKEPDSEKKTPLIEQAIAIGLASAKNVRFRGEAVTAEMSPGGYLSPIEIRELARAVSGEAYVKEKERVGFGSPRASEPAPSAGVAAAANATTPQP